MPNEVVKEGGTRRIKARLQGNVKAGQISIALTVPIHVTREVTKGETNQEIWDRFQEYEFEAEVTPEGILFRPFKIVPRPGW